MASSKKKSKSSKLGKLKAAARSQLDLPAEEAADEAEETAAANRPPADMSGFMQSMAADQAETASAETPDSPPAAAPEPVGEPGQPGTGTVSGMDGASIRETVMSEALVEVDSDEAPPEAEPQTPEPAKSDSTNSSTGSPADAAGAAPEIELPKRGAAPGYAEGPARPKSNRSMPKTRDSIYNVSSDIRLEDYTEGGGSGSGGGGRSGALATVAKIGGILLILGMLAWGGQQLMLWIDAPEYSITVANDMIDTASVAATTATGSGAAETAAVLSSAAPVHLRFDWAPGDLTTDFLRMEVVLAGSREVVVAKERRPPVTANYMYILGSLEPGSYMVRVLDRQQDLLIERSFRVN